MQGFTEYEETEYSELEKTKNQDFKCAEAGLAHYNKIHSANYKLMEATNSHGFFCGWVWYHCIFRAAPETSSASGLFFAELHALGSNTYHVITVAPVVSDAESYYCWYCAGKKIPHPVLTLSRDPELLYSEGMIDTGPPSLKLHYQKALEAVKKNYEAYCPNAYHNAQKISLGRELLNQTPGIKKLKTGLELDGASDLKPIFRISDNKVGLIFYKDKQNQEREQETDDLQSSTWEAELQKLYKQLGLGRQQEINHVPGTPSVFGNASHLQAGQEHQKGPNLSVPSYSSQSHVGHFDPLPPILPFQQWQDQQVFATVEKSYVVNSQAQHNLQQSSSQFQEVQEKDAVKNFNDAALSHPPTLPLVDVAPPAGRVKKMVQLIEYNVMRNSDNSSTIKGKGHHYNASGIGLDLVPADNVQKEENIPARSCVSSKKAEPWQEFSSVVGIQQDTI